MRLPWRTLKGVAVLLLLLVLYQQMLLSNQAGIYAVHYRNPTRSIDNTLPTYRHGIWLQGPRQSHRLCLTPLPSLSPQATDARCRPGYPQDAPSPCRVQQESNPSVSQPLRVPQCAQAFCLPVLCSNCSADLERACLGRGRLPSPVDDQCGAG